MAKYVGKDGEYLGVVDENRGYALQWLFPDDEGGFLGDFKQSDIPAEQEGLDACAEFIRGLQEKSGRSGVAREDPFFWFERERDAKTALGIVNSRMLAAKSKRKLPQWAKTALENGWKPPNGWSA